MIKDLYSPVLSVEIIRLIQGYIYKNVELNRGHDIYTFECKDIIIMTRSKTVVQVMKNMLRVHEGFDAYNAYITMIPHKEAI